MNLNNLSVKEVLRLCRPETDMEKRLLEIAEELQDDAEGWQSQARELEIDLDNFDCSNCDDTKYKIRNAIELIESGKANDAVIILRGIS